LPSCPHPFLSPRPLVSRFSGMKAWIPVCLALFIAQAPVSPDTDTDTDAGPSEELRQLQLRLQQLEARFEEQQAQVEEQQAQAEEQIQSLEEQQAALQARALELQQLQQERIVNLERAYGWFATIEDQLDVGNLDATSSSLSYADEALDVALSTALETGNDQSVRLLERARDRLFVIRQSLAARDVYAARVELQLAALEVSQAWQQALGQPDPSNLIR